MTKLSNNLILVATLAFAGAAFAQDANEIVDPMPVSTPAPAATPAPVAPVSNVRALPPMRFYSSIADDALYEQLKKEPALANLDKELWGTPLAVLVTHTSRPTAGGNAAGFFSAILSGSTLGLIPVVTNEELVVRYDVMLQGQPIATYTFRRTKTRAQNIWAIGTSDDPYAGLGKDLFEWVKGTAGEFAAKVAHEPKLAQVQAEIDYFFPAAPVAAAPAATPAQ